MLNRFFASYFSPPSSDLPENPPSPSDEPTITPLSSAVKMKLLISWTPTWQTLPLDLMGFWGVCFEIPLLASTNHLLISLTLISLELGRIPTAWKQSNITPIPKAKVSSQCSNYRPISPLLRSVWISPSIFHPRGLVVSNQHLATNAILT